MPQNPNLSEDWQKTLGDNWREVQNAYLHTIGNLTLTGYNAEMGDRPFRAKRDMDPGGFKKSVPNLNKYLVELDEWNEEYIKKQVEIFAEKAQEI